MSVTRYHDVDLGRFPDCHTSEREHYIATLPYSDACLTGLTLCGLAGISDLAGGQLFLQATFVAQWPPY